MSTPKVHACLSCTKRKIKCDKQQPECSSCVKLKADCIYNEPAQKKRKKESEDDRLVRYERILKKHGLLDADTTETSVVTLPNTGKLYSRSGSQRYVESSLWKSFVQPDEMIAAHDEPVPVAPFAGALLGMPQVSVDLRACRPNSQAASILWRLFKERIDPIVKVVHTPSNEGLLLKGTLTSSEECIAFAICFFAALSLTEPEATDMLGQDRATLVNMYHTCTNQALLNADFLRTTNIQVMQALILVLVATRGRTDAQVFWITMGVATRIAQRMGLHRDGSITGLDPFTTELNRRLFWQIPALEGFAGQFAGIGTSSLDVMVWDTKQPLNINDTDIWPGMTERPTERKGATDMIFPLVRTLFSSFFKEFARSLQQLEHNPADMALMNKTLARLDEVEDSVESQFLRYCDPMEPLHLCASLMARVAIHASRFRTRLPWAKSGGMSAAELHDMHVLALQIIDRFVVSQSNQEMSKFSVHTASFVIWDILIFMINHLQRASRQDQEATWQRLASLYDCQEHLLTLRLPIAQELTKLVLRAWDSYVDSTQAEPLFITRIRAAMSAASQAQAVSDASTITLKDVDEFDWEFWDSLIRDPESQAVGSL